MRLLLDQGLPRSTCLHLRKFGIEAIHTGDRSLAAASDAEILDISRQEGRIVVTLDADFHTLLVLSAASGPSVIRIRIEGLRAEGVANLLMKVLKSCEDDLLKGAMISVTTDGIRVRRLPLLR